MTPQEYSKRVNNLKKLAMKLAFSPAGAMPPMDPAMMGAPMPPPGAPMPPPGAPMDPAMMGAPMPPPGAPMDPAMMGAPMPPPGAPMDPAIMGGQMDPAMMGNGMPDPIMELLDMVHAIGYMLNKVCQKLEIPVGPENQKQNAEEAMLPEDQLDSLDAEQAAADDRNTALSDQAEEELASRSPGYLQDTLTQFNQA